MQEPFEFILQPADMVIPAGSWRRSRKANVRGLGTKITFELLLKSNVGDRALEDLLGACSDSSRRKNMPSN